MFIVLKNEMVNKIIKGLIRIITSTNTSPVSRMKVSIKPLNIVSSNTPVTPEARCHCGACTA